MRLMWRRAVVFAAALGTVSCGDSTAPRYTVNGNWRSGEFYILLAQRGSAINGAYLCAPRSVCAESDITGTITGSVAGGVVTLHFVSSVQPLSFTGSFESASMMRGMLIEAGDTTAAVMVKAPS